MSEIRPRDASAPWRWLRDRVPGQRGQLLTMPLRTSSFDTRKALEAILFVVGRLPDPMFHSVSEVFYVADRGHLEGFGRLIAGGH
jgi:hypothetical protein